MLERIRTARHYARGFVAAVAAVAALVLAANAGPDEATHAEESEQRTTAPVKAAVR